MTLLNKEQYLFERDENGELLPRLITLKGVKGEPQIKITPIPRGEWRKLQGQIESKEVTEEDSDKEIILKHCVEPKFTAEEIENLNPILATAIVTAIATETIGKGTSVEQGWMSKEEQEIKKKLT